MITVGGKRVRLAGAGRGCSRSRRRAGTPAEPLRAARSSSRAPSSCAATATTATGRTWRSRCSRSGSSRLEVRIVGDGAAELERALEEGLEHDLLVVSGGLGPTHDDRTVELLAQAAGPPARARRRHSRSDRGVDAAGRRAAAAAVRRVRARASASRRRSPRARSSPGSPGTAPALVLELDRLRRRDAARARRASCSRSGRLALETAPLRRRARARGAAAAARAAASTACRSRPSRRRSRPRAATGTGWRSTICARDFEIHVDLLVEPGAEARADELEAAFAAPLARVPVRATTRPRSRSSFSRCAASAG